MDQKGQPRLHSEKRPLNNQSKSLICVKFGGHLNQYPENVLVILLFIEPTHVLTVSWFPVDWCKELQIVGMSVRSFLFSRQFLYSINILDLLGGFFNPDSYEKEDVKNFVGTHWPLF